MQSLQPKPNACLSCYEELERVEVSILCGHDFHYHCILDWANSQNDQHDKCPLCKRDIQPIIGGSFPQELLLALQPKVKVIYEPPNYREPGHFGEARIRGLASYR